MKVRLCFSAQGRRADGCSKVTLSDTWDGYITSVATVAKEVLGIEHCTEACLRMSYYDVDGVKCNITRPTYGTFLEDVDQLSDMVAQAQVGGSPARRRDRPPGEVFVVYTGGQSLPNCLPQLVPTNPAGKRRKQRPTTGQARGARWETDPIPHSPASDTGGHYGHHARHYLPPGVRGYAPADQMWGMHPHHHRHGDSSTTTMGYSSPATPPKPMLDDMLGAAPSLPLIDPRVFDTLEAECEAIFDKLQQEERSARKQIVLGTVIDSLLTDLITAEQVYRESIEADSRLALQQLSYRKVTARPNSASVGFRRGKATALPAPQESPHPPPNPPPQAADTPGTQPHRRSSRSSGGRPPLATTPLASQAVGQRFATAETKSVVAVPHLPPPASPPEATAYLGELTALVDDEQSARRRIASAYSQDTSALEAAQSKLWLQAALAESRVALEREQERIHSARAHTPQRPATAPDQTRSPQPLSRRRVLGDDDGVIEASECKCSESQGLSSLASDATGTDTATPMAGTPKGAPKQRAPQSPSQVVRAVPAASAAQPPALKSRVQVAEDDAATPSGDRGAQPQAGGGAVEHWPAPTPSADAIPIMPMVQAALPFLLWPFLSSLPNLSEAAPELQPQAKGTESPASASLDLPAAAE